MAITSNIIITNMIFLTIVGCGAFILIISALIYEKKEERYKYKKEILLRDYPNYKRRMELEELIV